MLDKLRIRCFAAEKQTFGRVSPAVRQIMSNLKSVPGITVPLVPVLRCSIVGWETQSTGTRSCSGNESSADKSEDLAGGQPIPRANEASPTKAGKETCGLGPKIDVQSVTFCHLVAQIVRRHWQFPTQGIRLLTLRKKVTKE